MRPADRQNAYPAAWIIVWSVLLSCHGAAQSPELETVDRGITARGDGRAFSGRVLIARLASQPYVQEHLDQEHAYLPPDEDSAALPIGWQQGVLDLNMADFARNETLDRWRFEIRGLVLSGLSWVGFGGQIKGYPRESVRAREMYKSSVCDGRIVRTYDRSDRHGSIRPFDGDRPGGGTGRFSRLLVTTCTSDAKSGLVDDTWIEERSARREAIGDTECMVVVLIGRPWEDGGRAMYRLWVAPSLDFGVMRFEHVNVGQDGSAFHCGVTRGTRWRQAETSGLWVPTFVQEDKFDADDAGLLAWRYSTLYVAEQITVAEELSPEALACELPFDTRLSDDVNGAFMADPTGNLTDILHRIEFSAPDRLVDEVRDNDPIALMLAE